LKNKPRRKTTKEEEKKKPKNRTTTEGPKPPPPTPPKKPPTPKNEERGPGPEATQEKKSEKGVLVLLRGEEHRKGRATHKIPKVSPIGRKGRSRRILDKILLLMTY